MTHTPKALCLLLDEYLSNLGMLTDLLFFIQLLYSFINLVKLVLTEIYDDFYPGFDLAVLKLNALLLCNRDSIPLFVLDGLCLSVVKKF